jgi:hypothetical protein
MRFTKIKSSSKGVHLEWTTPAEKHPDNEVHHKLESDDTPAPEFTEALQHFIPEVLHVLELPTEYAIGLRVTGLSVNYEEDDRRGMVVTCLKDLEATNSPLVLNTPHMRELSDEDEDGAGFLSDAMLELLAAAEEQAEAFVHGTRMQLDLLAEATA